MLKRRFLFLLVYESIYLISRTYFSWYSKYSLRHFELWIWNVWKIVQPIGIIFAAAFLSAPIFLLLDLFRYKPKKILIVIVVMVIGGAAFYTYAAIGALIFPKEWYFYCLAGIALSGITFLGRD